MPDSLFSFSAKHRLKSRLDFQTVFDQSLKIHQKFFLARYRPNHLNHIRLGLTISKQQVRLAARRNQLRRLIREVVRQHPIKALNIDLVVMVKKDCHLTQVLKVNKSEILLDIKSLCDNVVNKW